MASKRDELIISALLANPTVKAAAKVVGISERQIYRKLEQPAFKSMYNSAKKAVLAENTATLQHYIAGAIEELNKIAHDENATPQVRANASEAIIRNSLRMTEQAEILTKLDELEKAQADYLKGQY